MLLLAVHRTGYHNVVQSVLFPFVVVDVDEERETLCGGILCRHFILEVSHIGSLAVASRLDALCEHLLLALGVAYPYGHLSAVGTEAYDICAYLGGGERNALRGNDPELNGVLVVGGAALV